MRLNPILDDKETSSDDELVVLVKSLGDQVSFDVLVHRHQASIRSALRRLTNDSETADDLAQETFVRAFTRIDQYQIGRSFRAWVGGIAYREFLQYQRTNKRQLQDALFTTDTPDTHIDESIGIDLDRALQALRPDERTAIILNSAIGMSHDEIATTMSKPLGTVKSLIGRGRRKLKTLLLEAKAHDYDK